MLSAQLGVRPRQGSRGNGIMVSARKTAPGSSIFGHMPRILRSIANGFGLPQSLIPAAIRRRSVCKLVC